MVMATKNLPRRKKVEKGSSVAGFFYVGLAVAACFAALAVNRYIDAKEAEAKQPLATDVYVVSYPKSGNNWLRFLLGHLYLYGQRNYRSLDFHTIEELIPDLEYGQVRKHFENYGKPRLFKSHQPLAAGAGVPCDQTVGVMEAHACLCPNCPEHWARALVLVRDGRDVMCSYFHFQVQLKLVPENTTFAEFLETPMYPGYNWAEHTRSFLHVRGTPGRDFHLIRYEDLQAAPAATLAEAAAWAGLPSGPEAVEWALARSSFGEMRAAEERGGLKLFDRHYADRNEEFRLTRKGKVGGWAECFSSQQSKDIFNKQAADVMKELGYIVDGEIW